MEDLRKSAWICDKMKLKHERNFCHNTLHDKVKNIMKDLFEKEQKLKKYA